MAGVINTGNIPRALEEGIKEFFGNTYKEHETQFNKIAKVQKSKRAYELDQQWEGFSMAPRKPEGEGVQYQSQTFGYSPKYVHYTYALGFITTMEAVQDNLYNLFQKQAKTLAKSMNQTKETVVANIYNRGFNPTYTMLDGDGQPLFSDAHRFGPSDNRTFSNVLQVGADLTEFSLEQLAIQIDEAKDPRGLNIRLKPQLLVVPPALSFRAARILNSTLQNDTANNAINALMSMGTVEKGYTVNNYLSSRTSWFLTTDAPAGVKFYNRMPVMFDTDKEFGTVNNRFKAVERYSVGWSDPRGVYGASGT